MVTVEKQKTATLGKAAGIIFYLEIIANLLTLGGLYLFGIAILQAYNTGAIINYRADGNLIVQGVNFRNLLTALLLTGSRNYFGAATWLGQKILVRN